MSELIDTRADDADLAGTTQRPVRVLVVDDDRAFTEDLARGLRSDPGINAVDVTGSLARARSVVSARPPDVVVLDPGTDGQRGLDLIADLDTLPVRPCVVVVTEPDDPGVVVRSLVSGAQSWMSRDAAVEDLVSAVTAARNGEVDRPGVAWGPVVMELMAQRSARHTREEFVHRLTARQQEILKCLVAGMTRAQVAEHLGVSPHTVRTHVRDMFRVMGVHSTPVLVARASAAGVEGIPRQR